MEERPESKKLSHEQVSYETDSKQKGESCDRCEYFIEAYEKSNRTSEPRCSIVASPIQPEGWCERFELEPGRLSADEYKKWREENRGKDIDMESRDVEYYRQEREPDGKFRARK